MEIQDIEKIGHPTRQSAYQPLYNRVKYVKKLFIGGLSWSIRDEALKEAFLVMEMLPKPSSS